MNNKNKKLRLLVTTKCLNQCPMCCNNLFDFDNFPVVDRWNYDEIMITGGEPMLFRDNIKNLVKFIRETVILQGTNPKIFVYTSEFKNDSVDILPIIDGIVFTPHKKLDVEYFIDSNSWLLKNKYSSFVKEKSLRLKIFPEMMEFFPDNIDLSLWEVRYPKWIKNCPVPDGEDFRKISKLW